VGKMRIGRDAHITRETVNVSDIFFPNKEISENLEKRIAAFRKDISSETYTMKKLMDQMSEYWDPACRAGPMHSDPPGYSPFILLERVHEGKATYLPLNAYHRYMAIKLLDWEKVDAFVARKDSLDRITKKQLEGFISHMEKEIGNSQQYQTLRLPHNVVWEGRDESLEIFYAPFSFKYWAGKTVLDVSGHIGACALEAKRCGAKRVVTFDLDPKLTKLGKELSELLELEIEFHTCDFWDFPLWGKEKFDVVMAHQCMYHFTTPHRSKHAKSHTEDEMLDILTNACNETFFAHTFVHYDDKPSDNPEGYRPTISQLFGDFEKRGFEDCELFVVSESSSKRSFVAHRAAKKGSDDS